VTDDVSLREYVDMRFAAAEAAVDKALSAANKALEVRTETLDREFREHLEQVRHENALAFHNADKAVQAALASAEKAVNKAETADNKRFDSVNEFRSTLSDQAAQLMPRAESEIRMTAMHAKMDSMQRVVWMALGIAAVAPMVLTVVLVFIR
jgi:hypothetical protein